MSLHCVGCSAFSAWRGLGVAATGRPFFFFFFLLACPPSFREADLLALFVHLKEPALRTGSLVNDPSLVCQVPGTKTLSPALTTAVGSHAIFTQHQEVEILSNRLK